MIFAEMRIKTYNSCTVLLADYNAKVFKKAKHAVVVAEYKLSGPLARVYSVAFAVSCVVCLFRLTILYKLHR